MEAVSAHQPDSGADPGGQGTGDAGFQRSGESGETRGSRGTSDMGDQGSGSQGTREPGVWGARGPGVQGQPGVWGSRGPGALRGLGHQKFGGPGTGGYPGFKGTQESWIQGTMDSRRSPPFSHNFCAVRYRICGTNTLGSARTASRASSVLRFSHCRLLSVSFSFVLSSFRLVFLSFKFAPFLSYVWLKFVENA